MDVLGILKEWFVMRTAMRLSHRLILCYLHSSGKHWSLSNEQFMRSRQKRGISNLTLRHMAFLTLSKENIIKLI